MTTHITETQKVIIVALVFVMNIVINISINIHMPAMPMISDEFHATNMQVQLSFILFILGSTFSRLFWGGMSDHLGRKKILISSMVIQILALFGCAIAQSIDTLILFRVIQSLGAGVNTVIGAAIISDLFTGVRRAKYMSVIELTFPIGLSLGPVIGAYIIEEFNTWRIAFSSLTVTLSIIALAMILWSTETLHEKTTDKLHQTVRHYGRMIKDRRFFSYNAIVSLLVCAFLIFVVNAPFIYMEYFKVSVIEYGYYQITPMISNLIGMIFFKTIVTRFGLEKCVKIPLAAMFLMLPLYFLSALYAPIQTPEIIIIVVSIQSVISAFLIPGLVSMGMSVFPRNKGVAASILGFTRTFLASIGMLVVSYAFGTSLYVTMISMSAVTLVLCILIFKNWDTFKYEETEHQ
jgi:DHA1 family bicyclomycin/chloramphenicol resistance-like MFS transporter